MADRCAAATGDGFECGVPGGACDASPYGGGATWTRHGWDIAELAGDGDPGGPIAGTDDPAPQRISILQLPHAGASRLFVPARDEAGRKTNLVVPFGRGLRSER